MKYRIEAAKKLPKLSVKVTITNQKNKISFKVNVPEYVTEDLDEEDFELLSRKIVPEMIQEHVYQEIVDAKKIGKPEIISKKMGNKTKQLLQVPVSIGKVKYKFILDPKNLLDPGEELSDFKYILGEFASELLADGDDIQISL